MADAAYQKAQSHRVTRYKVNRPAIPTKYACVGECTTPPPAAPSLTEGFASPPSGWWTVMTIAAFSFAFITLRAPKK
jgi:hypothetical protein